MTNREEVVLIERAQKGDDAALTDLIRRYSPNILRFGLKMCRDEQDAREVLQDTLLAAARGLRDFRGQSRLSTWLYTIARSFCIKHRRKAAGEPEEHVALSSLAAESTEALIETRLPDDELSARRLGIALEQAIASLDPKYREVLLLRDVEGLQASEVADVLGLGVDAVKSRLHRARAAVRESIAPLWGDEPKPGSAGCPDVIGLLSRHLESDIDPELCRKMEQHVSDCPRCRARCDSLKQALAICSALPAPSVPLELQAELRARMHTALATDR